MNEQSIRYALAKQVPDMDRGFTVATSYGDITIPPGKLAKQLRGHMQRCLARELAHQLVCTKAPAFAPLSQEQAIGVFKDFFSSTPQ